MMEVQGKYGPNKVSVVKSIEWYELPFSFILQCIKFQACFDLLCFPYKSWQ